MNRLVKLAGLLAIAPLIALASDDIATLRGGAINQEAQAPAINREVNSDIKLKRNYPMQPPLIPHGIAKYQVDLRANECLACHDWTNAGERNAPTLSMTHYMDRDGNQLQGLRELLEQLRQERQQRLDRHDLGDQHAAIHAHLGPGAGDLKANPAGGDVLNPHAGFWQVLFKPAHVNVLHAEGGRGADLLLLLGQAPGDVRKQHPRRGVLGEVHRLPVDHAPTHVHLLEVHRLAAPIPLNVFALLEQAAVHENGQPAGAEVVTRASHLPIESSYSRGRSYL